MESQHYLNSPNLNRRTNFPYLMLDVVDDRSFPRPPGFQVMHWHEDLQFIDVLEGTIEVATLQTSLPLQSGEGLFINKGVVHRVRQPGRCHYHSFLFPDYVLKFYVGSPAEVVVDRLAGNRRLPLCRLDRSPEHAAVLAALRHLSQLDPQASELDAYAVLTALCQLWLEFSRVAALPPGPLPKNTVSERMTVFLHYIEQHYAEPLSLAQLAQSAHVSRSECLRCFKASLQTSPYQYLMEYRLSRAGELLRSTDLPISEIASRVGFGQVSHFGKCFRDKTGMSPSAYRKAS